MIKLAQEDWESGEYFSSVYWYHSAYSTAFMSGLRWEVYKIYGYQIRNLREKGNLSDALTMCWQATKIWNQEGAATYECLSIEQEMTNQN